MKLKTLLVILAIVAAGAFVWRDIYQDRAAESSLREMEAREKLSKANWTMSKKILADVEATADSKIMELQGALDSSATHVAKLESRIEDSDKELATLRKSWGNLSLSCQGALKELDETWAKKFSLAQDEITVLKSDKGLLGQQLVLKDEIIGSLHVTLSAADDRIKGLEATVATISGKYIRARNTGYLKTVGIVAIAVLAVIT